MPYEKFVIVYTDIIRESMELLADDSFACFVVGDIRDKKGFYRNFVSDTIAAFRTIPDVEFYNEIIYLTPLGTLPIRAKSSFTRGRKVGKAHQNVLVFVKGDPKKAAAKLQAIPDTPDDEWYNGLEAIPDLPPQETIPYTPRRQTFRGQISKTIPCWYAGLRMPLLSILALSNKQKTQIITFTN